ncbi:uncharacterized protein LOC131335356 [Rhododendron vialii]|uniref:uncharacterized protein LOC131335356 n=1 Tax=Rhododendron vialii TaxID=182163 RepID=UPI00265FD881|nr:uncharacterized protein LOC131335356 [Rhododendron vialii]
MRASFCERHPSSKPTNVQFPHLQTKEVHPTVAPKPIKSTASPSSDDPLAAAIKFFVCYCPPPRIQSCRSFYHLTQILGIKVVSKPGIYLGASLDFSGKKGATESNKSAH